MSRRWRSILLAAGVIAGPIVIVTVWVEISASRRWAEIQRRTDELRAETASPLIDVHPLHGETLPGNGWDDYVKARKTAEGAAFSDQEDLLKFVRRQSGAQQSAAETSIRLLEPALVHLRTGARRATFQMGEDPGTISSLHTLALAVRARARIDAQDGRTAEALSRLAELVRIGLQVAQGDDFEDDVITPAGLDEIVEILQLKKPPRSDLETLLRDLPILEMDCQKPGRSILMIRDLIVSQEIGIHPLGPSGPRIAPGWRYTWSLRLYLAATADRLESWARTLQDLRHHPWPEAEQYLAKEAAEATISGNALLREAAIWKSAEMRWWTLQTRLKLIRAILLFRMTGERRTFPDPFGGTLQWSEDGVSSRGPTDDPEDDLGHRIK